MIRKRLIFAEYENVEWNIKIKFAKVIDKVIKVNRSIKHQKSHKNDWKEAENDETGKIRI